MEHRLFENAPAERFEDAYLLGNGSLGASVYGGTAYETVLLNHDTLWSGSEDDKITPDTRAHFQQARDMAMAGKLREVNDLINDTMLGYWSEAFLPLGHLHLTMGQVNDRRLMPQRRRLLDEDAPIEDYRRSLSLDEAVATVCYTKAGVRYSREYFTSAPDGVLVARLRAEGGAMDFALSLDSPLRHEQFVTERGFHITGRAPDRVEPYQPTFHPQVVYKAGEASNALRFACCVRVAATDGEVDRDGLRLYVRGATEAVLVLAAGTNYAGFRMPRQKSAEAVLAACQAATDKAAAKGWQGLLAAHLEEYQSYYQRMTLELGQPLTEELPHTRRMERFGVLEDTALPALVAQYARYLMISFSRPGTQPGNLQGVWGPRMLPSWAANYTANINVQMNYWCAEAFALADCHQPLLRMIEELAQTGATAAKETYGMAGWVAHHNTDLWRLASVTGEDATWAWWPFGGAWLCEHLWTHYAYTGDVAFLEKAYPVLAGAAAFLLDFVVQGEGGWYYTAPSTSPENKFFLGEGNFKKVLAEVSAGNRFDASRPDVSAVCRASTMDLALVREVLGNLQRAAAVLGKEVDARVPVVLEKLYPFKIGRHGQLCEWDEDFEECTPGMGHVSHLYSVFPSGVINGDDSPELFEAARLSLLRRLRHGAGSRGGWPGAWAICLAAQYGDGELCGRLLAGAMDRLGANMLTQNSYQIDAVMGLGAAVSEMLLQSRRGVVKLLPALPADWRDGRVAGMRARGGLGVEMAWAGGALTALTLTADSDGEFTLEHAGRRHTVRLEAGQATPVAPF